MPEFRCLHDPACCAQPWPLDFSHSSRCVEANVNAKRPDSLVALLARHSCWRWACDSDGFPSRDYGILCDCGKFIEASQETDDGARIMHGAHIAAILLAAGYRKCHEEWGIRYERTADPTMDNPSGEVTNTMWLSDEAHARRCVENGAPISGRNRRAVRRYVTEPEEL